MEMCCGIVDKLKDEVLHEFKMDYVFGFDFQLGEEAVADVHV